MSSPWTLTDALLLIRDLQPLLRPLGYHLALGGGVLNTGASANDLDLYLLPIYNEGTRDFAAALQMFAAWGYPLRPRLSENDISTSDGPVGALKEPRYYVLYITEVDGQRVDVFAVEH